ELLNSFDRQEVGTSELADKVARDQALAAKTLRLANSSFYGLQHKVRTIQQAITVLGFDSVRTMVAAASVVDMFAGASHAT
ncbi:HDOD domain-containing protein, partial [Clostridium perfringens]